MNSEVPELDLDGFVGEPVIRPYFMPLCHRFLKPESPVIVWQQSLNNIQEHLTSQVSMQPRLHDCKVVNYVSYWDTQLHPSHADFLVS